MSHHGREDEREECGPACARNSNQLGTAVELIKAIANGFNSKRGGGPAPHVQCDSWLEQHGYDCEATRRKQRERRATELDEEIARLQKEREALR